MKSNLKCQLTNGQVSLVLKTLRVLMERRRAHLQEHNKISVVVVDLVVVATVEVEVVASVVVAMVVAAAAMVVKEVDMVAIEVDLVVLKVAMVVRKVAMVVAVDTAAAEVAEEEEVMTVGKLP